MKRFLKILRRTVLITFSIIVLTLLAVQTSPVQNWLVGIATNKLSKDLKTKVDIKRVSISFFNSLDAEGVYVQDKQKDTLAYIGSLKCRITDWFFMKTTADLKYLGLEDAVIKLQRQDTTWNYEFIANYFSSSTPKDSTKKGLDIQPKKLNFKNLTFIKNDAWRGERMTAKALAIEVEIDSLLFAKKAFYINNITLNKLHFDIYDWDGNRPKNYKPTLIAAKNNNKSTEQLIKLGNLKLKDCLFTLNSDNNKAWQSFDGSHIRFSQIQGNFDNTIWRGDTLKTKMMLATKERSGFNLKKLKATLTITPKKMEFDDLDLETNNTKLTNYYCMRYNNFDDDFADYENKVVMDGRFSKAIINTNDVAYFAPDLKSWNKEFYFSGTFLGTVADFKTKNLNFKERSNSTTITGDLAMKGLPNIYNTTINFNNGSIKTNHKDLSAIVPDLKSINSPNLTALGEIFFQGNFNGTLNKFLTNGTITTSLGSIKTNLTMQLPKNKVPLYDGNLQLTNFNLGKFVNEPKLGIVNFEGKVVGKSFNLKTLETKLVGNFYRLDFNGYNYSNIVTNGTFKNAYFNGELKIDDPNLNITSQVEVDFGAKIPKFNIFGDIVNSNLKPLQFTQDDVKITGLLDVVFTGTNIDEFLGNAKLLNANISNSNGKIVFDSLTLSSTKIDSVNKMLHFAANDFNANVVGQFKILELPTSFQSFLHKYYPAYINEPIKTPQNQKFAVTINTRFIEPYLQLFDKSLFGFNDASLTGFVDTKENKFSTGILIPYGKYKNFTISGADIIGDGNRDTLKLFGNLTNFQVSDSLSFPNSRITIVSHDDISDVSIKTASSNQIYEADLNAKLTTLVDGVRIKFNPSSFILNEKKWNLDKEGDIRITKNEVSAKEVKFTQGFQEITINTEEAEGGNVSTLLVNLKNVVVGDITNVFTQNPKLEGVATGTIKLNDFYRKFNASTQLKVEQFRMDDDSIGLMMIDGNYDSRTGNLKTKINAPNEGYNFDGEGIFNLFDTAQTPINTVIQLKNSKIDIVQKFLGNDIFSELKGFASGPLQIIGRGNNLQLLGKVNIKNTSLKVEYTQVKYFIDSTTIAFENDGINFESFTIKDSLGNQGLVKGKLYEKGFKNMAFDFNLSTNQLLVLNTKAIHNNQFYGNVIGKANMSFKGPESNAIMTISGEPTAASHIFIPNSVSKENGEASFIEFKEIGEEMTVEKKASRFNLSVDLDLIANNKAEIDVILDDVTGDVIKATGDGRLNIKAGSNSNLEMRGRYNIEEGRYDFNFQSFIKKPFYIRKGGNNFIEWNGNPYDANINLTAVYEDAKQISINDLVKTAQNSLNNNSRNYRGAVYVFADLKGKLTKPDIKFRLDFPANSPLKNDDVFDRFLKTLESNENEMLKQVTYLIVFNSFAPVGEGGGSQTDFTSIGLNTISSVLTKQVNKSITNLLYKITGDKSITFDLAAAAYNSNDLFGNGVSASSGQFDRANVKFKIGKNFFNDNVIVTFGGDIDFNVVSNAQNGNLQWLPDLNVEVVLSSNKKLRMLIFSKNSLDISGGNLGRRNRQGIGLTYKKDFNSSPFENDSSDTQFK